MECLFSSFCFPIFSKHIVAELLLKGVQESEYHDRKSLLLSKPFLKFILFLLGVTGDLKNQEEKM